MNGIINCNLCIRKYDCDRCPWSCPQGKKDCQNCINRCPCCDADCSTCTLNCDNRKDKLVQDNEPILDRIIKKSECQKIHKCLRNIYEYCPFPCPNDIQDCMYCKNRCPCCVADCSICDLPCDNRKLK